MIGVDLLPKKYRDAKDLEKFFFLATGGLAVIFALIVSVQATLNIETRMYQEETKNLAVLAEQYQQVNDRFKELQEAEDQLQHRLNLGLPLISKETSILPYLDYFLGSIPSNIWLTSLELKLNGDMYLEGKALEYKDVAALIKWLEEERNLVVNLEDTTKEEGAVSFSMTAFTWRGGEKE